MNFQYTLCIIHLERVILSFFGYNNIKYIIFSFYYSYLKVIYTLIYITYIEGCGK